MSTPVRTRGLTHVALRVEDPQRSLAFYREVLGVVPVYERDGFVQAQTPGAHDALVFERAVNDRERGDIGNSGGIAHIGFRLIDPADIDAVASAVSAAGGTVVDQGEFCPGEPYLFCKDPDGYEIEIWFERPTPVDPAS